MERKSTKLLDKAENGVEKLEDKKKGMEALVDSMVEAYSNAYKSTMDNAKKSFNELKSAPLIADMLKDGPKNKRELEKFLTKNDGASKLLLGLSEKIEHAVSNSKSVEEEIKKRYQQELAEATKKVEELAKKGTSSESEKKAFSDAEKAKEDIKKKMEEEISKQKQSADKELDVMANTMHKVQELSMLSAMLKKQKGEITKLHVVMDVLKPSGNTVKEINSQVEDEVKKFSEVIAKYGSLSTTNIRGFMQQELKSAVNLYKFANAELKELGMNKMLKHASKHSEEFANAKGSHYYERSADSRLENFGNAINAIYKDLTAREGGTSKMVDAIANYATAYAVAKLVSSALNDAKSTPDMVNKMANAIASKEYLLFKRKQEATEKGPGKDKPKASEVKVENSSQKAAEAELSKPVSLEWLGHYNDYIKKYDWAKEAAKNVYALYPGIEKKLAGNKAT
ncbi:MAG: hypothetical protein QXN59_02575, partial [Candidatus Micrarchaeaceae archaeon]